jgi:hypothetical protein
VSQLRAFLAVAAALPGAIASTPRATIEPNGSRVWIVAHQ